MLSNTQFKSAIAAIAKQDDKLRELTASALTFALFHAIAHGNNKPMAELQAGAPYGWLRDGLAKVKPGRRDKDISERVIEQRANMHVAMMFAAQEQKRAIAKANREARPAKPAKKEAPSAVVNVPAWVAKLEGLQLTDEEVELIIEGVRAFRDENIAAELKAA